MTRWHDPDPLTVDPEPVRRQLPDTDRASGYVVLALVGLILALLAAAWFVATPRSAPQSDDARPVGLGGLSGAPHAGDTALTTNRRVVRDMATRFGGSSGAPITANLSTGWATWCAPTPRYCHGWGGDAMLGAVPGFRYGDRPYTAQVCGFEGGRTNCVFVTVVSFCGCGSRRGIPTVIDLSPAAFRQLAPLSRGVIRVQVDGVPDAPPTDAEEGKR